LSNLKEDLIKEFMSESNPIENSEVINVSDNDSDSVTFEVISRFQLNDQSDFFEEQFLAKLAENNYFNKNSLELISIHFDVTCEVKYEIMFTDLDDEEFYFKPFSDIKEHDFIVTNVKCKNEHINNEKLKEYLNEKNDTQHELHDKIHEELFIGNFNPFALEKYM